MTSLSFQDICPGRYKDVCLNRLCVSKKRHLLDSSRQKVRHPTLAKLKIGGFFFKLEVDFHEAECGNGGNKFPTPLSSALLGFLRVGLGFSIWKEVSNSTGQGTGLSL